MKSFFKIVFLALVLAIAAYAFMIAFYLPSYISSDAQVTLAEDDDDRITVMSTNVRYIAYDDFFKQSWFYRADLICEDVNSVKPDIIGFQEATFLHYDYLVKIMQGYDNEMAYRDEFVLSEGCPIFWRKDKFERIDSGSFWLSETPEVMSKDWGSEHYRICVYVILRDISSGEEFVLFNTHLDSKSEAARINGIGVVLDKIAEFGDIPAFLIGDLNAREDSETIKATKDSFDDAMRLSPISEETDTYHNWGSGVKAKRIDYILVSKGDAEVYEYHVIDNSHDGVYSSDHASIYIKVKLK